jgi:hypothetical protein
VSKNSVLTQLPSSATAPTFAAATPGSRSIPNLTSGHGERRVMMMNPTPSPAATPTRKMVTALVQPSAGAWTTAYTVVAIAAVTSNAPEALKFRGRSSGCGRGTTRQAPTSTIVPTATGATNTSRQCNAVKAPPATRPSENPDAPVAL